MRDAWSMKIAGAPLGNGPEKLVISCKPQFFLCETNSTSISPKVTILDF
jgi:hypothetical protein